jgi:hypothetical protein
MAKRTKTRSHAYYLVRKAVKLGHLPAPSDLLCVICKVRGETYHHPNGYAGAAALDVVPLCNSCHRGLHNKRIDNRRLKRARDTATYLRSLGVNL